MKVCSKCKETKFFDMFSRNKNEKDGYASQCKACFKAHYEANKEKNRERGKAYYEANKEKVLERCKVYYEANKEKFAEWKKANYEANKERYLENCSNYYHLNKERYAEQSKAYRAANKEKIAEYRKAYNEANKEKIKEQKKVYIEANKDKIEAYNEANKENMVKRRKAYYKANKESYITRNAIRRARKRNAIPKFLRNCEVEKQRLRDIYKLSQLFSGATGIEHHVDHMVPLSKGGPHWSGNLQILTATENLTKNAKLCKTLKKNIKASLEIARKEYNNEDHSNRHRD